MARRKPTPFSTKLGKRVKAFRHAAGMTLDGLAERMASNQDPDLVGEAGETSDSGLDQMPNKGHLSSIENGRGNPTILTLERIMQAVGQETPGDVVDLVISPGEKLRDTVIARTRTMSDAQLLAMLDFMAATCGPEPLLVPKTKKRPRHRAEGKKPRAT